MTDADALPVSGAEDVADFDTQPRWLTSLGAVWLYHDRGFERCEVALVIAPLPDPRPDARVWVTEGDKVHLMVLTRWGPRYVEAEVSEKLTPGTARPRW